MLVNKKDSDVFPLLGEPVKCLLYSLVFGFGVHDKEVLLCIRRLCDMLRSKMLSVLRTRLDFGSYTYAGQK